jgi:hypothetical protein
MKSRKPHLTIEGPTLTWKALFTPSTFHRYSCELPRVHIPVVNRPWTVVLHSTLPRSKTQNSTSFYSCFSKDVWLLRKKTKFGLRLSCATSWRKLSNHALLPLMVNHARLFTISKNSDSLLYWVSYHILTSTLVAPQRPRKTGIVL